jgi:hypothetical protein
VFAAGYRHVALDAVDTHQAGFIAGYEHASTAGTVHRPSTCSGLRSMQYQGLVNMTSGGKAIDYVYLFNRALVNFGIKLSMS